MRLRSSLVIAGFTALCCVQAQALSLLGQLDFSADIAGVSAARDGQRLLVQTESPDAQAVRWQWVDASDPVHPRIAGELPLDGRRGRAAISSDGHHVLVDLAPLPKSNNFQHQVVALDLADPAHPAVLWRQYVDTSQVTLAPDAMSFAAVQRNAPDEQAIVESSEGKAPDFVARTSGSSVFLSPKASFLAIVGSDGLQAWDLRTEPPTMFRQPASEKAYGHVFPLGVLDSGHVLVADLGFPRLGVYRIAKDMPRVAVLPGTVSSIGLEPFPTVSDTFDVFSDGERIERIDLRDPSKPARTHAWQSPPQLKTYAMTWDMLFVADASRRLSLYKLDDQPMPVDWPALNAAYRQAMASLPAKREPSWGWTLVTPLDAAGINTAISAPLAGGVTAGQAAAILNDYAFALASLGLWSTTPEDALRRAIALDPARTVAYLNLADVLRKRLPRDAALGVEVEPLRREVASLYREYLAKGGKRTPRIDAFLRTDLRVEASGDNDCRTVADFTNAGRLDELVSGIATGVPTGRQDVPKVDLLVSSQGTLHVPIVYAYDSSSDRMLDDFEYPEDGAEIGIVSLRERRHLLAYDDFRHPVSSTSIAGKRLCSFKTTATGTIGTPAR